jgi:hypothetical protein
MATRWDLDEMRESSDAAAPFLVSRRLRTRRFIPRTYALCYHRARLAGGESRATGRPRGNTGYNPHTVHTLPHLVSPTLSARHPNQAFPPDSTGPLHARSKICQGRSQWHSACLVAVSLHFHVATLQKTTEGRTAARRATKDFGAARLGFTRDPNARARAVAAHDGFCMPQPLRWGGGRNQ